MRSTRMSSETIAQSAHESSAAATDSSHAPPDADGAATTPPEEDACRSSLPSRLPSDPVASTSSFISVPREGAFAL